MGQIHAQDDAQRYRLNSQKIKTGLSVTTLFIRKTTAERRESYESGTTLAACRPFGPSSMENSTF